MSVVVTCGSFAWIGAVLHSAVTPAPTVGRLVAQEIVTGEAVGELRRCRPRGGDA
ncbi:hypothetical protein ACQEV2_36600 [Streptomyces sp. CA-251387]|uniref:hypothetical protein n=1 Tax=Streptomyces sp. CA-251387 TaxID=3240064 RepID=UPI003D918465